MAKTATKTATRKPTPTRPPTTASGVSKAQKAAAEQGRAPQASSGRRDAIPAQPKSQAVATRPATAMADMGDVSSVPAFMRQDMGLGKESIGRDDIETPRLKLIQGLSPELEEYNELRAGNFFHSAAEMIFDEPFRAVAIYMDTQYILWRPRGDGGGILARAADGVNWSPSSGQFTVTLDKKDGGEQVTWKLAPTVQKSGLANWGTLNPNDPKSPPAATQMYNYVLAFPDHPELMPAVLTFQRSSIKKGRQFNGKLKSVRLPIFGLIFEFSSFKDHNSRGEEFYNVQVRGAGMLEDESLYNMYRQMHLSLREAGLQIKDIEEIQDEDPANNSDDGNDDGRPAF